MRCAKTVSTLAAPLRTNGLLIRHASIALMLAVITFIQIFVDSTYIRNQSS